MTSYIVSVLKNYRNHPAASSLDDLAKLFACSYLEEQSVFRFQDIIDIPVESLSQQLISAGDNVNSVLIIEVFWKCLSHEINLKVDGYLEFEKNKSFEFTMDYRTVLIKQQLYLAAYQIHQSIKKEQASLTDFKNNIELDIKQVYKMKKSKKIEWIEKALFLSSVEKKKVLEKTKVMLGCCSSTDIKAVQYEEKIVQAMADYIKQVIQTLQNDVSQWHAPIDYQLNLPCQLCLTEPDIAQDNDTGVYLYRSSYGSIEALVVHASDKDVCKLSKFRDYDSVFFYDKKVCDLFSDLPWSKVSNYCPRVKLRLNQVLSEKILSKCFRSYKTYDHSRTMINQYLADWLPPIYHKRKQLIVGGLAVPIVSIINHYRKLVITYDISFSPLSVEFLALVDALVETVALNSFQFYRNHEENALCKWQTIKNIVTFLVHFFPDFSDYFDSNKDYFLNRFGLKCFNCGFQFSGFQSFKSCHQHWTEWINEPSDQVLCDRCYNYNPGIFSKIFRGKNIIRSSLINGKKKRG